MYVAVIFKMLIFLLISYESLQSFSTKSEDILRVKTQGKNTININTFPSECFKFVKLLSYF